MTDRPPAPPGTIASIVASVLGYIDRPWKAIVVVVLLILLGLGYAAFEERSFLREVLVRRPGPVALKTDVAKPLDELIADTTVDLAMVWAVDLSRNVQQFVLARQRGGGLWTMTPARLPVFFEGTTSQTVIRILRGSTVCDDPQLQPNRLLFQRLTQDGWHYVCAVPVPPGPNSPLVGLLYIAWKAAPEPALAATARADAEATATDLVKR